MTFIIRNPKIYALFLLVTILFLTSSNPRPIQAQTTPQEVDQAVETIFNTLSPAERVGQLFLVSYYGNDIAPGSEIAQLIQTSRVGGVILSAQNENFNNFQSTPAQVLALTNNLQALAQTPPLTTTQAVTDTPAIVPDTFNPLPIFIATEHEGDGYPFTQIRQGMAGIPNQMAVGATWNLENARTIGEVVGHDLSLLGINVLFGPSLDVLDNPRPDRGNLLGTRAFGGSPHWVGEMGAAYIQGIHQGSNNRVLTIVKHFPGFGSSDRAINQGVPTILKSLDDLRRVEFRPFFKATDMTTDNPQNITDGLMTAHVRYQGLQGNVPISLDARNLPAILALKEFSPWRESGGLVVSAPLGAPAALEGIAAGKDVFPARRLAQDAFLAGNDILQLTDFAFADAPPEAQVENIKDVITFFQEKYATDPNFQTLVDQRVRRILKAKIKVFGPDLLNANTQQPLDNLQTLGATPIDLSQIAQAGVTLITPSTQEGRDPLPNAPQPGENILIFVDDREGQDCLDCPEFPLIDTNALERIILQFFGPNATGQIQPEQINSLGFTDLKLALESPELAESEENDSQNTNEEPAEIDLETQARVERVNTLITDADWIIFSMLNIHPQTAPQSDAVRILLRDRLDDLRNKNLILFAFNAPYFLDETEISQLTAYYGLYSKTQYYLEAAARLLFQQFEPSGASPVAIPAIGPLDLSPDPNQIIEIIPVNKIDSNGTMTPIEETAEPVTTLDLDVGEGILFKTGVIVDRNGHPVPNGTLVDFFRFYPLEGLSLEPLQSSTKQGVAEIAIVKERDTPLQVRASSNLAVQSVTFNVGPGIVDTPTPTPTLTPTPTDTPSPTATVTEIPTLTPTPTFTPEPTATATPVTLADLPPPATPVDYLDLVYSLLGATLIAGIAFTLGGDRFSLEQRLRSALVPIAAGLVGYITFTTMVRAFPQAAFLQNLVQRSAEGHWVAPLITILFAVIGLMVWHLKPGRVFGKTLW